MKLIGGAFVIYDVTCALGKHYSKHNGCHVKQDQLFRPESLKQATQSLFSYALFRPESAIVIALSILGAGATALGVSFVPGAWWMWLGLGGEAFVALASEGGRPSGALYECCGPSAQSRAGNRMS